jgi:hypothetical protein
MRKMATVSQNKTAVLGGYFYFRLKRTCFGPYTGPSSGLKWRDLVEVLK